MPMAYISFKKMNTLTDQSTNLMIILILYSEKLQLCNITLKRCCIRVEKAMFFNMAHCLGLHADFDVHLICASTLFLVTCIL